MNNFFIVTPVYNDWESLNKLLFNLNKSINYLETKVRVVVINDFSTEKINIKIKKFKNIQNLKVLNLRKNVGSQKGIYIALKYIKKFKYKSTIAILDSDGEDNPFKLKKLINLSLKKKNYIFVANRSKRTENFFLKSLNQLRLIITFFLTGKYINFGNFSSFSSQNLKNILSNDNLWLAYPSGILKNCNKIKSININKNKRYYGKSKVNLIFLLNHSIKIMSVFRKEIFIRSLIMILFLTIFIETRFNDLSVILFFLFLNIFFNIFYHINSLRFNALNLIKNIKNL